MLDSLSKKSNSIAKYYFATIILTGLMAWQTYASPDLGSVITNLIAHPEFFNKIHFLNFFGNMFVFVSCIYLLAQSAIPNKLGMSILIVSLSALILNDTNLFPLEKMLSIENLNRDVAQLTFLAALSSLYLYGAYSTGLYLFQIMGRKSDSIAAILVLPIVGIFVIALMSTSFSNLDNFKAAMHYYRECALFLIPFTVTLAQLFNHDLRLGHPNFKNSLLFRFEVTKNSLTGSTSPLVLSLCGGIGLFYLSFLPSADLHFSSFSWIASTYILHYFLLAHYNKYEELAIGSIISDSNASNYLKRHYRSENNWAATTGIKTSSFIIDHSLQTQENEINIPTTLKQIRNQIIKDSVTKVINNKFLNYSAWENKIHGSINPELCNKPCVESIILFTCLYMDGIPLLERRLKTLSGILPVIDEGSSKIITDKLLNHILGRNTWLFYLDYTWVDQYIIHTNDAASYQYDAKILDSEQKLMVAAELRRRNLLGNYIWISDSARKQMEIESQHLSRVIIPVELKISGEMNTIIFLMKFEDIIPRLQRYYLLDNRRVELKDMAPSKDSKRLCNLIELQLSQEFDLVKAEEILNSIKSFPWSGFRAKDSALELILNLYSKTMTHISRMIVEEKQKTRLLDKFKGLFVDTISEIGYPSQSLHHAQLQKLSLRNQASIFEIAKKPANKNFYDAWLYLSSNPIDGNEKELLDAVHFLEEVIQQNWGSRSKFIKSKAISTLNQMPRRFIIKHKSRFETCLNSFYKWVFSELDMDDLLWLMDVHLHLSTHTQNQFNLDPEILVNLRSLEGFPTVAGSVEEMVKLAYTSRLQKLMNTEDTNKRQGPIGFLSESA